MIDEFGQEIPLEDLDDCCRKEVLEKRRIKELTQKLRAGDRSNIRFDMKNTVFSSGKSCVCCAEPRDYSLLSRLRLECQPCGAVTEKVEESEEESEEDDALFADDFVSADELQRRLEFEVQQEQLALAKRLGFGIHVEDSLEHVVSDISVGLDVVVHLYDPALVICAKLDLYLETLSQRYYGTKFRRVQWSRRYDSDSQVHGLGFTSANTAHGGTILSFRNKTLCFALLPEEYSENETVFVEDVFKALDACKVLTTSVPLDRLASSGKLEKINNPDGEDEEEQAERFCDDPECEKRYVHEHVGRGNAAASFLLDGRAAGMEALGQGALQRI